MCVGTYVSHGCVRHVDAQDLWMVLGAHGLSYFNEQFLGHTFSGVLILFLNMGCVILVI
jgi:hypothetical protein